MPAAQQRKCVEELRDGGREIGVGGGGRTDLLESGNREDGENRTERIRRKARYSDSAVLKRRLIEVAPGIAESKLVERRRREYPVVVAGERVAARDRMPDHSGRQGSASIRQGGDRRVVVAEEGVASEDPVLFAEVAVEPEVGLILIVAFSRRADKIVSAGNVRQRVMLKDLAGDRIEAAGGGTGSWVRKWGRMLAG